MSGTLPSAEDGASDAGTAPRGRETNLIAGQDRDPEPSRASRYQALLAISSALATQRSEEGVLHSLPGLLSNVVAFDVIALLMLDRSRDTLVLRAQDLRPGLVAFELGTEIPYRGTQWERVIEEQVAIYISDLSGEVLAIPNPAGAQSLYIAPVSTPSEKLGMLVFGALHKSEFNAEDIELMRSVTQHVSIALESALATAAAARERDRLSLLLEINNHVVTKLDMNELFHAAAASLRKYFASEIISFWLFDEHSSHLKRVFLDFPETRGYLADLSVADISQPRMDVMGARTAAILTMSEISELQPVWASKLQAESIVTIASVPLVARAGLLGTIYLGSRRENCFREADLDLLRQVGDQIALALDNALAWGKLSASRDRLEEERVYLKSEIASQYNFENIVGKSEALQKVLSQVSIVAPTDSTVLLHGETGTGKELFARAIHNLSPRHERTFVRLNCAAIPSGLVESELFGHEKGAFTGALMQKRGRFELADHGTLFLDEIGDISLDLQPKLLRALQEHEFERLGSTKTIYVDVRLIAATHRDLQTMIRNNQFREDLFYRLNVFPIEIPPLRQRRDDIPLLVHYFVLRHSRQMQKRVRSVPKQAMEALVKADWPGNIRELENFIERCVIFTQGEELTVPDAELKKASDRSVASAASSFEQAERQFIIDALRAASGRVAGKGGAAEHLGLKRTTLQNKMRKLNINRADYSD